MPRSTAATLLLIVTMAGRVQGQESIPLIAADVDVSTFGIAGPESVLRGRVSIAYTPTGPSLGVYYLRDKPPPRRSVVEGPRPAAGSTASEAARAGAPLKALWVWNTRALLDDQAERESFLNFIAEQAITRVFLYLPAAEGKRPSAGYIPFDGSEIGPLIGQLRVRGALVYGLDGDRDYVLAENHAGVFRTVERMAQHNRSVPPDQRFYGMRYDIEPYLAPGFQGGQRQELLNGYVELIAGAAQRAHAGDLAIAVDIPFWLDSPDEETGEYMEAELDGERATVIEHVISLVDDIAIMDYRTHAEGPNGAIAHAQGELALAGAKGVGVFIGVETTRLVDEDLHTFSGPPAEGLPTRGDTRWVVLEGRGAGQARLWLVDSPQALEEVATRTAGASVLRHWPAGRAARVPGDLQSFFALGREPMERVTGEVTRSFSSHPAFLGLAFHDYLGLRALLGRD